MSDDDVVAQALAAAEFEMERQLQSTASVEAFKCIQSDTAAAEEAGLLPTLLIG